MNKINTPNQHLNTEITYDNLNQILNTERIDVIYIPLIHSQSNAGFEKKVKINSKDVANLSDKLNKDFNISSLMVEGLRLVEEETYNNRSYHEKLVCKKGSGLEELNPIFNIVKPPIWNLYSGEPQYHDHFLIIDKKNIYHLGASLKCSKSAPFWHVANLQFETDLGKNIFAFSKLSKEHLMLFKDLI